MTMTKGKKEIPVTTKLFGGKRLRLLTSFPTKAKAQVFADKQRKAGYSARVLFYKAATKPPVSFWQLPWEVYTDAPSLKRKKTVRRHPNW